MFDFGALPPEINSARMYAGAGAGPLMATATAWNSLATELSSTAVSYESVVSELTGEQWLGPASVAMAAAVQPYIAWLNYTASAALHAGTQAMASAAAYEAAFAMTVPPPLIAANRALLAALVATNFLGINTPAIMAAEAQYIEMWAQDAAAMYGYAAASATAGTLSPLTPAAPTTNPGGAAAQAAAVGQAAAAPAAQLGMASAVSDLQSLVSSLSTPLAAWNPVSIGTNLWDLLPANVQTMLNSLDGLLGTPLVFNGIQQVGVTAAWFVGAAIPTAISYGHTIAGMAPAAAAGDIAGAAVGAEGALASTVTPAGAGGALTAGLGDAAAVGGLSVPTSWSAATPATLASATAPLEGSGWAVPAEEAASGSVVPGMPGMAAAAGKGAAGFSGPRYGFKPTVMPKTVLV